MKKIITSTISILFLISFVSIFAFINQTDAQAQSGIIYGKILDKDSGIGVKSAIIRIEKNNEEIHTILPDDEGNYKVANLEEGDYTFSIYSSSDYELFEDKVVSIKQAEEKEVNFILIPRYDYIISGKVYKSDGKTPIEDAELLAYNSTTNLPDGFANNSKKDGSYTIKNLKPATYDLLCSSDKAAFPIKKDITVSKEKTSGINFIAYDNFISGVVKDEQGNLVKNAKVSVQYIPSKDDIKEDEVLIRTMISRLYTPLDKTDNDGKYKISSLTPGSYNIEVRSETIGRKVKKNIAVKNNVKISNLDFVMGKPEDTSTIYGKVTKEDGVTPVANAQIGLIDSNNVLVGEILEVSDKGTFKIEGLSADTYYLGIAKEGMATVGKEIIVQPGEKINVRLVMEVPGSISGVVYYKDKKTPAENVVVFATKDDSTGSAVTNENGFYEIEDLDEYPYSLYREETITTLADEVAIYGFKDPESAVEEIEGLEEYTSNAKTKFYLLACIANIYFTEDQFQKALTAYQNVLIKYPDAAGISDIKNQIEKCEEKLKE